MDKQKLVMEAPFKVQIQVGPEVTRAVTIWEDDGTELVLATISSDVYRSFPEVKVAFEYLAKLAADSILREGLAKCGIEEIGLTVWWVDGSPEKVN